MPRAFRRGGGTLLNYILDDTPEKTALTNRIAKERGLVPFRVNSKVEDHLAPLAERIQPPVAQWLRGFYDAEFVVTDSFHACVFSILFNKPFLVVGNPDRGMPRFNSLLGAFGLEDRLITDPHAYKVCKDVDWMNVMAVLAEKKNSTMFFLIDNLNTTDGKQ